MIFLSVDSVALSAGAAVGSTKLAHCQLQQQWTHLLRRVCWINPAGPDQFTEQFVHTARVELGLIGSGDVGVGFSHNVCVEQKAFEHKSKQSFSNQRIH